MWVDRRFTRHFILEDYEPTTTRLFVESIRPGATVLDIGAHIGFYTLLAARASGPNGHVFAFEPCPSNLAVLKRNANLNRYANISCLGQAVSDEVGRRQLIVAQTADCNSFYPHPFCPAKEVISVDCVTVDHFLGGRRADVIKIDAEGAEVSVLRGMREALARNRAVRLFVELNPACLAAAGQNSRDLVAALRVAGLSVRVVDEESGRLRELDERLLGIPLDIRSFFANLYCTGRECSA